MELKAITQGKHRCVYCRRTTTAPGPYGPGCQRKIERAAKVLEQSGHPVAVKAAALLRDGGLINVRPGIWTAVAEDGSYKYFVHLNACNCPAGLHNTYCNHRAALYVLTA